MDTQARQADRDRLAGLRDEIDKEATRLHTPREVPQPMLRPDQLVRPPAFGSPQRDAINSLIDKVVSDVCEHIAELEKRLEELRQQVLVGAAAAKATLQEQVEVCLRVNDEAVRIGDTIRDITQRVRLS